MPPKWVYPYVISDIGNLLGAGDGNAVLEDFAKKLSPLDLPDAQKADLAARAAVPAYRRLADEMARQQAIVPTDDGVWRFKDGDQYYAALLASYTTTDLSAEEIHAIGLAETARIHGEMRVIMATVGFTGTLQEFFAFTRDGRQAPRIFRHPAHRSARNPCGGGFS